MKWSNKYKTHLGRLTFKSNRNDVFCQFYLIHYVCIRDQKKKIKSKLLSFWEIKCSKIFSSKTEILCMFLLIHPITNNKPLSQFIVFLKSDFVAFSQVPIDVESRLRYRPFFWGSCSDIERLFDIQKRCLRSIFNLKCRDHSCRDIFVNHIHILTGSYIVQCIMFVHKNYNHFFKQFELTHIIRRSRRMLTIVQRNVGQLINIHSHTIMKNVWMSKIFF